MKGTVLNAKCRVKLLKLGFTKNDMRKLFIMYGGNHARI
jgi:hypothetical protein